MATFSKTGTSASYEYNGEGQRISKTVNGTKTEYFLDASGTILGEKKGVLTILYLFDETGRRIGYSWATDNYPGQIQATYHYVFNGQGDVIALQDSNGVIWARYVYDAWGKLLAVTDADGNEATDLSAYIANLNSFRYRNYYYDVESGLYFLNTRSYDPETGRFINADAFLGINTDMATYNLFAYCGNQPSQ